MNKVLEELRALNPELDIKCVCDPAFANYGQVLKDFDVKPLLDYLSENIEVGPKTSYIGSMPDGEAKCADTLKEISDVVYGGMPIQFGVCAGHNTTMNGMEWHKGDEVNIAVTDTLFFFGKQEDIDYTGDKITYDSNKVQCFFLPAGWAIDIYGTCLHLAPVHAKEADGFNVVVILPRGTNEPLTDDMAAAAAKHKGEPELLKAVNKWLIMHPEAERGYMGIVGPNLKVKAL